MHTDRHIGHAPRSRAIGDKLISIQGGCIGCAGCTGLCQALIEALSVPDAVLRRGS